MAEQALPSTGARDAGVIPLSLAEEPAAEVLEHLGAKDVQRTGAAMSEVGQLSRVQVAHTLDSYHSSKARRGRDDLVRCPER
jgi:flagellar motor switch protein FliG